MPSRAVRRLDLGELRPVTRREDGTILADAHLTRCGIFHYVEPDGSVRRELREREQVMDPESLASFVGRPVTVEHPPVMLDSRNAKQYAVGALQGDVVPDDDHVRSRLAVYDHAAIAAMDAGKRQVSLGYVCDLDETPGVHPVYGPYDARQLNIRGNHVAIVDTARAGQTARIRLDAAERVDEWSDAAREAALEARKAAAGKTGEDANRASVQAITSGKGHDKAAALHRAAAAAAKAAGDKKGAKEHEAQAKEHEKQAAKPADKRAAEEFSRLRAAYEHNKAEAEFASKRRTAELSKYVTKKDAGILGMPGYRIGSLLSCKTRANMTDMSDSRLDAEDETKPQGGKPAAKDPDPKDEANRNAAGENDAKPGDKASEKTGPESEEVRDDDSGDEGPDAEDPDEDEDDDDPEDDGDNDEENDEDREDAYSASYNKDGELTDEARHKMSTSSFAVPDREGLPIHDPEHVRAAMSRFGQYDFKSPEERHAAFNRIGKRAKQFGVSTEGFEKAHRSTLDHQDKQMIKNEKISEANKRADSAEAALAKAQGEIASLKKDIESLTAKVDQSRKDAADAYDKRVATKVALLAEAGATGAKVDASMKDIEIKRATVKHVDSIDVPADKPEAYVDAMYDGAIRRFKADTKATAAGAQALGAARQTVVENREQVKTDSAKDDEAAAEAAARARSATAWTTWAPKHTARKENA